MVNSYADKGDVKKVQSSGFHVAGDRYVTIKADDRSLYGRKVMRIVYPTVSLEVLTINRNRGKKAS